MSEFVQKPAGEVRVGDQLRCENGSIYRVAKIDTANWIKDADRKPLLEFFEDRRDRHGIVVSRSDLVEVVV